MDLKVGIAGLRRGRSYVGCFTTAGVEVTTFCDANDQLLKQVGKEFGVTNLYTHYEEFLRSDMDIVVVAVPLPFHAEFSIAALGAGKHVLSEVPPVNSVEEAAGLAEAVKKAKTKYMLAQNTCYWAHIQAWKEIINQGRIGEIMYAEAEYIHDCREFFADQARAGKTWRLKMPPLFYCTHSLGPLLCLMNDRCILAQGFQTEKRPHSPGIEPTAAAMEVGIFKTGKGAVIKILCGFGIVRKPAFHYYSIYGTKGTLETNRVGEERTLAYFDDIPHLKEMISIPLSAGYTDISIEGTHGGAEYLLVKDFVESILLDKPSPIGIEEALNYGLPGICAHQSAISSGGAVEIPSYC